MNPKMKFIVWMARIDEEFAPGDLLYHFNQFGQHMTFPRFRKISENRKNREKIISGVRKKWV